MSRIRTVALILLLTACTGPSVAGSEDPPSALVIEGSPTFAPPPTAPPSEPATATVTATPRTWADTAREVRSGVVHLSVQGCQSGAVGSGSLVAPDLVLTAAHVVAGASYITLRTQSDVTTGYVVSYDPSTEIALVRARRPLSGHVFDLTTTDPDEGTGVAALGYPLDESLSITDGIVSAKGVRGPLLGFVVPHQLLTSVAVNPGNSGGPLVLSDGTEAGVVSSVDLLDDETRAEGRSNAISAAVASRAINALPVDAGDMELAECDFNAGESLRAPEVVDVQVTSTDERAPLFAQILGQLGQGINDGDYEGSFDLFTSGMQQRMGGLQSWRSDLDTSYWRYVTVEDVEDSSAGIVVTATLQTEQSSDNGYQSQTCSVFHNRYSMVQDDDQPTGWAISRVRGPKPVGCEPTD